MTALLKSLRTELQKAADPKKAPQMQAYMKSKMPYHGIQTPLLRKICKNLFAELDFPSEEKWKSEVLGLWRNAEFREERYAALNLTSLKNAQGFQTPKVMGLYEEIVVTGAWWDYVDSASHRVGFILREHPGIMKPLMLKWSRCPNLWKRRVSIICQLGFKGETDLKFLYSCIAPSIDSKEFFLQKAIGWALREYAWTDPNEIESYVRRHENFLRPLSKREARKNIAFARRPGRN